MGDSIRIGTKSEPSFINRFSALFFHVVDGSGNSVASVVVMGLVLSTLVLSNSVVDTSSLLSFVTTELSFVAPNGLRVLICTELLLL
jgi:hypothetical protein